jgi:hypothetical protein
MAKKNESPLSYCTKYIVKGQYRQYHTKTLTDFHAHIRNTYGGTTMELDTSVDWPFGVFAKVVARVPTKK